MSDESALLHRLAARNPEAMARASRLPFHDQGHGYDWFGMNLDAIALADTFTTPLYERWFRVRSEGHAHIPASGPAILAVNHSGALPYDGLMLWIDVLHHTDPTRILRFVADYFVPWMPFAGSWLARCGVVTGTRGNLQLLLEHGELVGVFPEGVVGIGKPYHQRYELQRWRQGHAEFAIRHRAPVIPVAIVGAEEQMPQLGRIPLRGPLPHIPIAATPIPLPVQYHIYYGAPLRFDLETTPADADDPRRVFDAAQKVRTAVQALIDAGLRERRRRKG